MNIRPVGRVKIQFLVKKGAQRAQRTFTYFNSNARKVPRRKSNQRERERERESFGYGFQQCGSCGCSRRLHRRVAADMEGSVVAEDQHTGSCGHGFISVKSFSFLFMEFYVYPSFLFHQLIHLRTHIYFLKIVDLLLLLIDFFILHVAF